MFAKKGFTLIELITTIVILAIIIIIGQNAITGIIKNTRENAIKEVQNNVKEMALSYVMGKFYLEKCSPTFSNEVNINHNISNANNNDNKNCVKFVSIATLKTMGSFNDDRGYCKDTEEVMIYRYNDGVNSEYRAFLNDSVCAGI